MNPTTGKMRLHSWQPFTSENGLEEMLLYFLHSMSGSLEDIEAATRGDIDNAVVIQLCQMEQTLGGKLDLLLAELRLMNQGRVEQ
jgi:tetrahydromethanopterin S-methyltransferase subunit H